MINILLKYREYHLRMRALGEDPLDWLDRALAQARGGMTKKLEKIFLKVSTQGRLTPEDLMQLYLSGVDPSHVINWAFQSKHMSNERPHP